MVVDLRRGEHGAAGNAVRGEEDGRRRSRVLGKGISDGAEAFGKRIGEERMVSPVGEEEQLDLAFSGGEGGAAIQANAGAGILRRKADDDGTRDAVIAHPAHHVGNVGLPVAHAHIDRQAEFALEQPPLLQRERGQGAAADQREAMANFFDDRRRHFAAAGYA